KGLLDFPLNVLCTYAAEAGKKLLFGDDGSLPGPVKERCHFARIKAFEPADYEAVCRCYLGERAAGLDYQKIFRFARELNAHQLKAACQWFHAPDGPPDTEAFIDYLRSQRLSSNVDLGEVQPVHLHDLCGVDDVIRS